MQNPDYRVLASLTGIRGVAALWVMLFHLQQAAQLYFPTAPLRDAGFVEQGSAPSTCSSCFRASS